MDEKNSNEIKRYLRDRKLPPNPKHTNQPKTNSNQQHARTGRDDGNEKTTSKDEPTDVPTPTQTCSVLETRWSNQSGCIYFVVDNYEVKEVLCGHSELKATYLYGACVTILNKLGRLLKDGRNLPSQFSDPWQWVPRELNKYADSICNLVMNNRRNHFSQHPQCMFHIRNRTNLTVCSDGGVRGNRVSGTGWAVWASTECGAHICILEGGSFIKKGMSSFEAELFAVLEAVRALNTLL